MLAREEMAWAGGLFEGEGSVFLQRKPSGGYPTVAVEMCDEDPVRRFHQAVGIGEVTGPYRSKQHPEWKPKWRWRVHGFERTQAVVAMLWPYLGERRRGKAQEVLHG